MELLSNIQAVTAAVSMQRLHYQCVTYFWQGQLCRQRINIVNSILVIDFSVVATTQLHRHRRYIQTCKTCPTGMNLQLLPFGSAAVMLLCDVSSGHPHPLVTASFRQVALMQCITCRTYPSVNESFGFFKVCLVRSSTPSRPLGTHVCCFVTFERLCIIFWFPTADLIIFAWV